MDREPTCTGFQWDEGNSGKNWIKHRVSDSESEKVFLNRPLLVADDELHSEEELRHYALGRTNAGRPLFVSYTLRGDLVRVISARDMTPFERREYERAAAREYETDSEV